MHGPGNFPPQHGQGPETSVSTTSQQPVPPQLPPPPYQHADRTQHSQMMEKGPSFYPAPRQAYPPPYANDRQVSAPTSGISSSGQSYLIPLSLPPPPSQTQGHSTHMTHPFSSPQQHSWTQNVQHAVPPLPPTFGRLPSIQSGPEMSHPHPPPRLQPPMLSQGQALFRGFVPSPLPGPVQGLQHTPLTQPPPPNHAPYKHGHFGPVVHPISQDPHTSSAGLLPPPLPPSPPPGPPPPPAASPPPSSPSSLSKRSPISPFSQSQCDGAQQHDVPQEAVQPSDSPARSVQVDSVMDKGRSHSPTDSNMDIEDEMTEKDENKRCSEIVDGKSVLVSSECEVEKELHEQHILAKNTSPEESAPRNTFFSDKSESADHREDLEQPNAEAGVDYENVSTELVKGTSPFKLLQDYASDDNSDGANEPCIKDIVPAPVYPSGESVAACLNKDFKQKSSRGSHVRPDSDVGKTRKEDGKNSSTDQLKVDEFGRLVREGSSGSDSDDLRHSRRHGKRGRRRSRSRSPHYRRSPQRRRQKRSRSRSWSPRKPRSRSRSPSRHGAQYWSDITRRDRGPSVACFDFKRGKCYRGASCRYSHSDSTRSDLSRVHKSKYELSPKKTSKDGSVHKETESVRSISDKDVELLISSVAETVRTREEARDNLVNQVPQSADYQPQPMDAPSSHPDTISYQSHPATGSASKPFSSETFSAQHLRSEEPSLKNSDQPSQFLQPPPPTSQAANAPPQMPRDCIMMPQSLRYQSLPTPPGNFTPYQAPISNQHASFSVSGNSAWNSLPPPPRRPNDTESTVHLSSSYGLPSSQFREDQLPSRNDYPSQVPVGPYSTEMHTYSQVGESNRQSYPPAQQPNQHLSHLEDSKSIALPTKSTATQQFGGPSTAGEGGLTSLSAIPAYYNPYASTFEQPASLKVSLNDFSEATGVPYNNSYGGPFGSSHVSTDVRVVDTVDSKNMTCLTTSNQAIQKTVLNSTGDQYDPLFDSIEPSSNSLRTPNDGQKHDINEDSDMKMRLSGSNKPLDFAENTKQKEAEAVAVMSSLDNDEYGETAEAEVGAVENGSPSDPIDEANTAAEETEIDQVKTSGRSKKGKDSRSMKLFKGALADFVKEVLKPSWRQGNMSKEAFKTIVKKTVDKVCGAMKSHQVPKSQTKIDHYIDSSQRKLTKLVMGYVDKYVKV